MALTQAQNCPTFACSSDLSTNVCANRASNNAYQLNNNGCSSTYHCSIADLFAWISQFSTTNTVVSPLYTQNSLDCQADAQQVNSNSILTWTPATCYPHQANRGFKNGKAVVTCARDIDCQLVDGAHTTCSCTFRTDAYGICEPDLSNDLVFAKYWEDCDYDLKLTNQNAYNYWKAYREYYVYLQSSLTCTDIFQEIQEVNTLFSLYDSATVLTAALAFFL